MQEMSRKNQYFTDSVIRRMTRISIDCGAINLAQGFPDFDPPKAMLDRLNEVCYQGPHQYPITMGAPNFRQALARKAGAAELGEEPVGAAARAQYARLVVVASDASDHTWRRALSFVAGTTQITLRVPFTKDQLGFTIGRKELAIAAFTDPALALAFVKALGQPEKHAQVLEALENRTRRVQQRQKEAKAHTRNVRFGKKK